MFVFPAELPYNIYIQALPLLHNFINFTNDITSFYKEECQGETHNLVSFLAEAHGEPKSKALFLCGGEVHGGAREDIAYLVAAQRSARDVQGIREGVLGVPFGWKEI